MVLNKKILEIAKNSGLDVNKVLKVAFALHVAKEYPNLLREYLEANEITNDEVEHIYRIELFDFNGEYSLKFPLFVNDDTTDRFSQWWKMKNKYGLTTDGHVSNKVSFLPLARTVELVSAFEIVDSKLKLDFDKSWKVISKYYRDKQYVSKLDKYLLTAFEDDYEVYEEETYSKMI